MPNDPRSIEPVSHAFLSEDILHRLRAVAEATSSALDAMIDSDPAYRAGMEAAVRAMGRAINLDPSDDDARSDMTGWHRNVHLRRDVRNILQAVYDATDSTLESGGVSGPAFREGFTNTLRSVARSLDLWRAGDELGAGPAITERPQRVTVQGNQQRPRQLPAPAEGAYYLESRSGKTPTGLEQYMDRYGIKATIAADASGRALVSLQGVSENRREWAEYVIDRWADGHGWKRQEQSARR